MESGQRKKNRNALTAAIKRLGEDEAAHLVAKFGSLNHSCKKDWAAGNHMIAALLNDGFSHNQIRQLLHVGGTRIRRITREKSPTSSCSPQQRSPSHVEYISSGHTDSESLAAASPSKDVPSPTGDDADMDDDVEAEFDRLRAQVDTLETYLADLLTDQQRHHAHRRRRKKRGMPPSLQLSWEEVASAMAEMHNASATERRHLFAQTQTSRRLLPLLRAYAATRPIHTCLVEDHETSPQLALGHVNVVAHPEARKQGLDWLSKVVYHNTDRMFARYHYPPTVAGRVSDAYFDFSSPAPPYVFVVRGHLDLPVSLSAAWSLFQDGFVRKQSGHFTPDEAASIAKRFTVTRLDLDIRREITPEMWYLHHTPLGQEYGKKNLFRIFHEPDRVIVAGQTIFHDELAPPPPTDTKHLVWYVLEQVPGEGRCRVRWMSMVSSTMTHDGFYSIDEEATKNGLDLSECPEDRKEARLTQHLAPIAAGNSYNVDHYLGQVFASVL
ncbi:Aste57867_22129 [Aphanomyces stellatus]|uniref:Aste57867_22129 protein n=1 Tax=Aphanomyces stellatus TaxID=120398 RepID=A0A485LJK6_9STRA|nr:hypothetical protein As57867_022060 [Aphanomyces stellatus]VFT98797.1 Aste57867_22129 [Aphanomyces stellatus]